VRAIFINFARYFYFWEIFEDPENVSFSARIIRNFVESLWTGFASKPESRLQAVVMVV
jgi:hypothetical protein